MRCCQVTTLLLIGCYAVSVHGKPLTQKEDENTNHQSSNGYKTYYAEDTSEQINKCGVKGSGGRTRRYILHGSKWNKRKLTWKYYHDRNGKNAWRPNNPNGLTENDVRNVLKKATNMWQTATNIRFTEQRRYSIHEPDIRILFARGWHNCSLPFTRRRENMAHAFKPLDNVGIAGDIHFNDDVLYTVRGRGTGKDLMWVALHELGHSLGLEHSPNKEAIMYDVYPKDRRDIFLHQDDIKGVQAIYGRSKGCRRGDKFSCKNFENGSEYYCRHKWTRKNCPKLCNMCG